MRLRAQTSLVEGANLLAFRLIPSMATANLVLDFELVLPAKMPVPLATPVWLLLLLLLLVLVLLLFHRSSRRSVGLFIQCSFLV
jgi:hypothetical protein